MGKRAPPNPGNTIASQQKPIAKTAPSGYFHQNEYVLQRTPPVRSLTHGDMQAMTLRRIGAPDA
jgi:hypothetical protein